MPAGRGDRLLAGAMAATSLAVFLAVLPFIKVILRPVDPFISIYETALAINDLITAALLFGQFSILRSRALWVLACGYLYTAMMAAMHVLSFPGLFAPAGLLGAGPQSTPYLYCFWHSGFPLCVIAYASLKGDQRKSLTPNGRVWCAVLSGVALVCLLVCALTLLATQSRGGLPAINQGNLYTPAGHVILASVWGLSFLALAVLWRRSPHSVLDLWLLVVMCAWVFDIGLSAALDSARFDLGWYAGRAFGLLASLVVLLVLLQENVNLYFRLVAAHSREQAKNADLNKMSRHVTETNRELAQFNRELQSMNAELKTQQDEINQTNEKLKEASRAKSDFLANMSHEFRTPLNSIIGFTEVLQDTLYGPLNPKQSEYVGRVLKTSRHLLRLINDILDLSKVEAGKMILEITSLVVNEVIDDVILLQIEAAAKHGVALSADTGGTTGLVIEADERKLKQILFNLINNAIKFTPEGGQVTVSTAPPTPEKEQELMIAVTDTGMGISRPDLDRLFKEFSQLESPYTKKHEGTGLGLALTRKLVALHGGEISVESEPGRGSRFFFTLPTHQAHADATASTPFAPAPAPSGRARQTPGTILLVDDDEQAMALMESVLHEKGFTVLKTPDSAKCLDLARKSVPDAIVLDLIMPGINGFEVARRLRADPATTSIPILVFTSMDLDGSEWARLGLKKLAVLRKGELSSDGFAAAIGSLLG